MASKKAPKAPKAPKDPSAPAVKRERKPFLVQAIAAFEKALKFASVVDGFETDAISSTDFAGSIKELAGKAKQLQSDGFVPPVTVKSGPRQFSAGDKVKLTQKAVLKYPLSDNERHSMIVEFFDDMSKMFVVKTDERQFCIKGRHLEARTV